MRIKGVFFDVGNTLVSSDKFMKNEALKLNQKLLQSIGYDFSLEELKKAEKKAVEYTATKYRGSPKVHEKGEFLSVMCKFLGLDVDRKTINKLDEKFKKTRLENYELRPHVKTILSSLKKKYKLAIISNGSIDGINHVIDIFDLRGYFNLIIISEEVGKQKCTSVPIKIALEKLGLKPKEAVMIGDRIDEDILGAKKLGMISVKYNYGTWKNKNYSGEEIKPDYVIDDLLELEKILGGLDTRK
ncbi:MAG: HAD-IA family hydrolase [Candidatus Aenigmarchaeota archaeon]|nr:HAD-IA family hydrolase [Candidatus Aenigmarchaeota archaeon]